MCVLVLLDSLVLLDRSLLGSDSRERAGVSLGSVVVALSAELTQLFKTKHLQGCIIVQTRFRITRFIAFIAVLVPEAILQGSCN